MFVMPHQHPPVPSVHCTGCWDVHPARLEPPAPCLLHSLSHLEKNHKLAYGITYIWGIIIKIFDLLAIKHITLKTYIFLFSLLQSIHFCQHFCHCQKHFWKPLFGMLYCVVEFCLMSSVYSNLPPLIIFLSLVSNQKSHGATSEELEAWRTSGVLDKEWVDDVGRMSRCGAVVSFLLPISRKSGNIQHSFIKSASRAHHFVHQASCSLDLAPCDFRLFPELKTALKGRRFESSEDIKKNFMVYLYNIPNSDIKNNLQQLHKPWQKYIHINANCTLFSITCFMAKRQILLATPRTHTHKEEGNRMEEDGKEWKMRENEWRRQNGEWGRRNGG